MTEQREPRVAKLSQKVSAVIELRHSAGAKSYVSMYFHSYKLDVPITDCTEAYLLSSLEKLEENGLFQQRLFAI